MTNETKKIVKQVTSIANEKLGKDWSLVIRRDGGELQVEARKVEGVVVRSVVWCGGRIESRTSVA
jgi:hypothetical protein